MADSTLLCLTMTAVPTKAIPQTRAELVKALLFHAVTKTIILHFMIHYCKMLFGLEAKDALC